VTLPTFLVVGAPRCGTTSLHYYLRQHRQIAMSLIKEPNFFLFGPSGEPLIEEPPILTKSVRGLEEYEALFKPTAATAAVGEASPLYLYTRETPGRILDVCGTIKIICVLRRPAERAWSHFVYAFADLPEAQRAERFAELVDAEIAGGPGYAPYRTATHLVRVGRYAEQVRRYQDAFGADNVLALLTEDLDDARDEALRRVLTLVGADPDEPLELEVRYNLSGVPAPTGARRVLRKAAPWVKRVLPASVAGRIAAARVSRSDAGAAPAPPLDPEVAQRIVDWCRGDVDELAGLIGRDLDDWQAAPAG
jgi:hypothetical protein